MELDLVTELAGLVAAVLSVAAVAIGLSKKTCACTFCAPRFAIGAANG
jgi:hypothetical protein